jgi:glutamine cyclotransferase
MKKLNYSSYLGIIILFFILSCSDTSNKKSQETKSDIQQSHENIDKSVQLTLKTADNKNEYTIGDIINFIVEQNDTLAIDSVQFFMNGNLLSAQKSFPATVQWNSINAKTGKNIFEVRIFGKSFIDSKRLSITLLSDIIPEQYSYKVINTFHHDRSAYTQGLVYENGYMYEATGLRGASTLRKVQLGTGEVIQTYTLPQEIFGEGIAIVGDRIIQLSYQAYTGFVYDKNSFNPIMKFNYPKAVEGWGLTYDGTNLIMSDGSYNLHFLDPESFTETGKLEVYDNKGPVKKLNELEIIDGILWANIYLSFKIVQIDLKTGKVLAYIDLTDILPQRDYEKDTDVLNGIAYDTENKRIFVTGKKWPKLFEIQPVKKH